MSSRLFLGQAANYKAKDVLRHTFSFATKRSAVELRDYLAEKYGTARDRVVLMNNGRSAIAAGLKLTVPSGAEVIINGFTCYAVLQAIEKAGCVPVYADIDQKTLNFSRKTLEKVLKNHPKAKAVVIQNTLGIMINITEIEKIADEHGLVIVEDLAHCAGMRYADGREVGSVGAVAALSFGKGKSLDTITGGALIVNDRSLNLPTQATKHPKLSDSLRARWYPLLAAIGRGMSRVHLQKYWYGPLIKMHFIERAVDAKLSLRQRPAYWQDKLVLRQLKQIGDKSAMPIRTHLFVRDRGELIEKLDRNGYNFREIWYDVPVSPVRYYKKVNFPEEECPAAVKTAKEIINLPTYYEKGELHGAFQIIKEYEK